MATRCLPERSAWAIRHVNTVWRYLAWGFVGPQLKMIQLDAGQERLQRKPLRAACRDTIRAAFRCPPGEVLNCSNSTIDTIPCDFNEKALRYKRLLNVRETMLHKARQAARGDSPGQTHLAVVSGLLP